MATREEKAERVVTLDTRAAPDAITYAWGLTEQQWLDRVQSAVARADTAESALRETRAERDAADAQLVACRVSNASLVKLRDELTLRALAAEGALRETREALERATDFLHEAKSTQGIRLPSESWYRKLSAFLARLPTEEE